MMSELDRKLVKGHRLLMNEDTFIEALKAQAATVEGFMSGVLTSAAANGEIARPQRLVDAVRHAALNGGKRFRPFLVMESARVFGEAGAGALHVAAAIECVHCYSLVHDDLPAMDNDDTRRGQPTVHRKFDEATAILAGDCLLTYAFDLVSDSSNGLSGDMRARIAGRLARASGIGGMAGGQALDLAAADEDQLDEKDIAQLQAMKTGALIRFACEAGAIVGGAGESDLYRIREYGQAIGSAFQLADDLLDISADAGTVGKATGKDAAAGKATLVGLNGEEWARKELARQVKIAEETLQSFGSRATMLVEAARFAAQRKS